MKLALSRIGGCTVALCLATLLACRGSAMALDASNSDPIPPLLEKMDSIPARIMEAFAYFRDEVRSGIKEDGWTDEKKSAAIEWLEKMSVSDENAGTDSRNPMRMVTSALDAFSGHAKNSKTKFPAPPEGAPLSLAKSLGARLRVLLEIEDSLAHRCAQAILHEAEAVIASARTSDDYDPLRKAIDELLKREPGFLLTKHFPFEQSANEFGFYDERFQIHRELGQVWVLIAPEAPLVLPDPDGAPEEFWRARKIWISLRKIHFSILERPSVARRFDELNLRFRNRIATAISEVDDLIIHDATLETLSSAVNRLHRLESKPFDLRRSVLRPGRSGPRVRNYQAALLGRLNEVPELIQVSYPSAEDKRQEEALSRMLPVLDSLIELLRAERSGNSESIAELKSSLSDGLIFLSKQVSAHLRQRYFKTVGPPESHAKTAEVAPADASVLDSVDALVRNLRELAGAQFSTRAARSPADGLSDTSTAQKCAAVLLDAWLPLSKDGNSAKAADCAEAWRQVAARGDSKALLDLRANAARSILLGLGDKESRRAHVADALPDLMRAALREAFTGDDLEKARRIMNVESATAVLPNQERNRWQEAIQDFEAGALAITASPEEARAHYLHILKNCVDPACAAFAFKMLEQLRAAKDVLGALDLLNSHESCYSYPKRRKPKDLQSATAVFNYHLQRKLIEYRFGGDVFVQIDPVRSKICSILRLAAEEPQSQLREPKWSVSEACKRGRELLEILNPPTLLEVGDPQVRFVNDRNGEIVSVNAHWEIFWPRKSKMGYLFDDENILMDLNEDSGLEYYGYDFWSRCVEPPSDKRPLERNALDKVAQNFAQQTVKSSRVFRGLYGERRLTGECKSYIRIVNPNQFLLSESLDACVDESTAAGRSALAWVFWFPWSSKEGGRVEGGVAVYLDAFTGGYLGGNAGAL